MSHNGFTEEQFLAQTKAHKLTILREEGLYRHLRVAIPGTSMESWHVHTWPGYLAMVGDMGDWVFQRTEDMLCFFRGEGDGLKINPHYWAEKLQAQEDRGWVEFSIDAFYGRVKEFAIEACSVETFEEIPEEKREDLDCLLRAEDEFDAVAAMREFDCSWLDMVDFWDGAHTCKEVRDHFLFACYAIVWTVKLYDAQKATP